MTTVILTRTENTKSASKLGYPLYFDRTDIPSGSTVIRWGNGMENDQRNWEAVLNKASVLQISTDKLAALQKLSTTVKTPEVYRQGQTLPAGHRYVCRPASHAEGSDFELSDCRRRSAILATHHATRFIEDTREYRVWFVRDKYLVAKRVPRSAEGQSSSDPCRSKWGYEFQTSCFAKLKTEMDKARLAIPLDFGAVDVLWKDGDGNTEGQWYFLEFNSAPSLDHAKVLAHFKTHLQAIVGAPVAQEVVEQVPPPQRAANRPAERPYMAPVTPSGASGWEAKYRAKLVAEKKAKEEAIYREVYGD